MRNSYEQTGTILKVRINGAAKHARSLRKLDIFIVLLVVFVAFAALQSFELNTMLTEARSIGEDVSGLRTDQMALLEQYD